MQISGSLSLLLWSVVLGSPFVALAAVSVTAFAAGLAAYSERNDLDARFGEAWRAYRSDVRDWWPRRTPWQDPHCDESVGRPKAISCIPPTISAR